MNRMIADYPVTLTRRWSVRVIGNEICIMPQHRKTLDDPWMFLFIDLTRYNFHDAEEEAIRQAQINARNEREKLPRFASTMIGTRR